jgi:predicted alpha/beta-hydrolase family hydrolase
MLAGKLQLVLLPDDSSDAGLAAEHSSSSSSSRSAVAAAKLLAAAGVQVSRWEVPFCAASSCFCLASPS